MNIVIEFLMLDVRQPQGKKYKEYEVTFKLNGKTETKKLIDYYAKEVCSVLDNAQKGDVYTIETVKDGEFRKWVGITKGGASDPTDQVGGGKFTSAAKEVGKAASGNTYSKFDPEADARRQVMIVRQSSCSTAANMLKTDKKPLNAAEVIAAAKEIEAYVLGIAPIEGTKPQADFSDMDDDIPY